MVEKVADCGCPMYQDAEGHWHVGHEHGRHTETPRSADATLDAALALLNEARAKHKALGNDVTAEVISEAMAMLEPGRD